MTSTFWRVDPTHEIDGHTRDRMRMGDIIVLAFFDESTEEGEVIAVGLIREIRSTSMVVSWRRAKATLRPSPWGIPKWRSMPVFKFPKDRAAHYRLAEIFSDAFPWVPA